MLFRSIRGLGVGINLGRIVFDFPYHVSNGPFLEMAGGVTAVSSEESCEKYWSLFLEETPFRFKVAWRDVDSGFL